MGDCHPTLAGTDRAGHIRRVVEDALARRSRGEALTDEVLCQQNPALLPELAVELRKLALIDRARLQSQQSPHGEKAPVDETAAFVPTRRTSQRLSHSLRIRCPLCHEPLEIVADQALDNLNCLACHGHFSLAGDDPALKQQPITRLARFELVERLGMGGFGTVWKARDVELERDVALKIPRSQLNADEVEEFLHEARVAAKLRHPRIVSVHEIGREGDTVYIISDLVDGVSLAKHKEERRLTHREAAVLLTTVCDALQFAHDAGIVHRDLKPGNVLIDREGQPHITDFGLAKKSRDEVEVTIQGEILGTPAYMSPEQARGEAHLADSRTDVYAIGVMLFELLTDFLPFRGNVMMLAHHAIHTEPPSPRSLNPSVSRDLETICLKCLEKQPSRRYGSARELADELRRYLAGDAILARPISRSERLWRWCKRKPRIPALSAALLGVVLLAYALAWLRFQGLWTEWDRTLTERALGNVAFTAQSVAQTAGNDFEQLYDVVEEAARDAGLRQLLHDIQADEKLRPLCEELYDPARHERDDDETRQLRNQLRDHPTRQAIQQWLDDFAGDMSQWATFVMLADGLQVARLPVEEETIGRNYIWRGYALERSDEQKTWRPDSPADHLQHTFLSPPFVSEYSNAWVVVVSTPVVERQPGQEQFLGIVGVMVRLGSFARLPGNVASETAAPLSDHSFAVLVDSRHHQHGHILQHPLYGELSDKSESGLAVSPRRKLLDRSPDEKLGVAPMDWTTNSHYVDPFAAEGRRYDQRWLAAKLPVEVRGADSGLSVIVQESYDQLIGQPLGEMRRGLVLLSLVTLLLSAAVIVPLWVMILRLVR